MIIVTLPLLQLGDAPGAGLHGRAPGWLSATAVCAQATLGDAVIVLALFALGSCLYRDTRWFVPFRVGRYGVVVLAALVIHMVVERGMLGLGRWGTRRAIP